MKISNQTIAHSVLAQLESGKTEQQVVASLAAYLVAERRSKDADAILRQVERALTVRNNQVELRITSAHGLTQDLKEQLGKQFVQSGQKVIINEVQDPAVVGGVLVESSEKRLDLTVRRQLQRLKEMGV